MVWCWAVSGKRQGVRFQPAESRNEGCDGRVRSLALSDEETEVLLIVVYFMNACMPTAVQEGIILEVRKVGNNWPLR